MTWLSVSPGLYEWIVVDDHPFEMTVDPQLRWIKAGENIHRLAVKKLNGINKQKAQSNHRLLNGNISAPIPGQILQVLVEPGQEVHRCQPLLILEAMKMDNEILATHSGMIAAVHVSAGMAVRRGEVLIEIA